MVRKVLQMGSVYDAMSGYIAMVLSFFGWGVAAAHNPGLFQSIVQLPMDFYIILGALSGIFVIFPRFIMHKAITTLGDQGSMKTVKDKSEYGFVKLIALNLTSIAGFVQVLMLIAVLFYIMDLFTMLILKVQGLVLLYSRLTKLLKDLHMHFFLFSLTIYLLKKLRRKE